MVAQKTTFRLALLLLEADGTTEVYNDFISIEPGFVLPDIPEIGAEAFFNIDGIQHKAKILRKTYTYFIADVGFDTLLVVQAQKVP